MPHEADPASAPTSSGGERPAGEINLSVASNQMAELEGIGIIQRLEEDRVSRQAITDLAQGLRGRQLSQSQTNPACRSLQTITARFTRKSGGQYRQQAVNLVGMPTRDRRQPGDVEEYLVQLLVADHLLQQEPLRQRFGNDRS